MGLKYCWALECKRCGKRELKSSGPSGHSGMFGDCGDHLHHRETVVLGPKDVRKVKVEIGSYGDVRELFVDEEYSKADLLALVS